MSTPKNELLTALDAAGTNLGNAQELLQKLDPETRKLIAKGIDEGIRSVNQVKTTLNNTPRFGG